MYIENTKPERIEDKSRPSFPKRAVITAGMPYGNKGLHFGHIGGVFVHADTYARFLRDRIGKENVIFISGTDCYGSPISEHYRKLVNEAGYNKTILELVKSYHEEQKETLNLYDISTDLFAASALGRAGEIHSKFSDEFIRKLYSNGYLEKITTSQFYDAKHNVFLNGRQVTGQCPIMGCSSEHAYADECSLGHQYMPHELINPKSVLSGERPEMRDVTNWYFKLDRFHDLLKTWMEGFKSHPTTRQFVVKSIEEFLEPPVIYVKKEYAELLECIRNKLPNHTCQGEENTKSIVLVFENLDKREGACLILSEHSIRYRTGKTLVPLRITGNIEWGVDAPAFEGIEGLTVWVWPESLWAPISFTMAFLERQNKDTNLWKDWWCSDEAKVYQFIGEDNVYFYGPAEMAMFMAYNDKTASDDKLRLPELIVNNHILFLNKKASSSGAIKPPMAKDLLDYYTAEQLRAHFLGLGLGLRSVSFQPKPFNPAADEKDSDPVLKEGNLLTNVLNRAVRTAFYTAQKYYNGKIPVGNISDEVLIESEDTILEYEKLMCRCEFHLIMSLMDTYIRNLNKYASKNMRLAEENGDAALREQTLVDLFHMVRTAAVLMHPIAPKGSKMIAEYLNINGDFWSWDYIFENIYFFMDNPKHHKLKFLESKTDFFKKHPSQTMQTI